MKVLQNLIFSLSPEQIALVQRSFLVPGVKRKAKPLIANLFELLLKDVEQELTEKSICLKLFKKVNYPQLFNVKSKLKTKLLEVLISDQNFEYLTDMDELDLVSLRLRKKLLQLRVIYRSYGNLLMLSELFDEIIQTSEKYELYDIESDTLQFKKRLIGLRSGKDQLEKISERLLKVNISLNGTILAGDLYNELVVKKKFSANSNLSAFLKNSVDKLNQLIYKSDSKNIVYYHKLLQSELFEMNSSYSLAREKIIDLIGLLKENKSIYRKSRLGFCYGNLSAYDVWLGEYKRAFKNAETSQSYLLRNSYNFLVSEKTKFYAAFYGGDLINAGSSLVILLNHMKEDQGDFGNSMYEYFNANLLFRKGKFNEAYRILSQNLEINKDKPGWDISTRVLAIMCMVELKYEEESSRAIEALRKHIDRVSASSEIKQRDKIIFKILKSLDKQGFAFSAITSKDLPEFDKLEQEGTDLSWKPFTPELIPFHQWLGSKLSVKMRSRIKVPVTQPQVFPIR